MKAVRLHHYGMHPVIEEVADPKITSPYDVIVTIGGAGLCRTDLHIIEGQFLRTAWELRRSWISSVRGVRSPMACVCSSGLVAII